MSSALDRRLAALEAVSRTADYFILIVIRFIDPGVQAAEATFATAMGLRFTREPAETEDDFIAASTTTPRRTAPPASVRCGPSSTTSSRGRRAHGLRQHQRRDRLVPAQRSMVLATPLRPSATKICV